MSFSRWIHHQLRSREQKLLRFFIVLFVVLRGRLLFIQIMEGNYYEALLMRQHTTSTTLQAQRGHIYVTDKAGTHIQLTENVDLFNLFLDPKFIKGDEHKSKIIELLTPIISDHLCVQYGVALIDKISCIENLERFTQDDLLPDQESYYTFSGDVLLYLDRVTYEENVQEIIQTFDRDTVESLVTKRLQKIIRSGIREYNYVGFFDDNPGLIASLESAGLGEIVNIVDNSYVYINPSLIRDPDTFAIQLQEIFAINHQAIEKSRILTLMQPQEIRYVRITTGMNSKIAMRIQNLKSEWYSYGLENYSVPLLHSVGLENYQERYYPHGSFMANVIGYVTDTDQSFYGVEEYLDSELRGKNGKIIGMSTPWIGDIGANNFEISQPIEGNTIFLTIDPTIQKEIENTANYYHTMFRADSVAITVIDPFNGQIKGLANAPTFDPNAYQDSYKLRPVGYEERYLIDDLTFNDIPVYTLSGDALVATTSSTRQSGIDKKYVFENLLGPQVFVDKNISFPYEPGSIFKAITLGVGIDSDSIGLYEFYQDDGKVRIGPYEISNVSSKCIGYNTFSHALAYSCNVGMVRIAQKVTKYIFYEYLKQLGFGKLTGIELAGEESGTLPDYNNVSLARFFNNTYGQGLLATPLQMATAYSSLVNNGVYTQPTIIDTIYDNHLQTPKTIGKKEQYSVFKSNTSDHVKQALVDVFQKGGLQKYQIEGYSLGGKTGTSEIAYKGKYQGGAGRTNGSFVGLITAETSRYVVAIQVRRPRTSPWGSDTAGKIFSQIADFLIAYDAIDE